MSTNTATLVGNVARDPELRNTADGTALCKFSVAVNSFRQGQKRMDGFFNVVVWGQHAEDVAEVVAKGERVSVQGYLQNRSWEGDDGKKRYAFELVADEVSKSVRFASSNDDAESPGEEPGDSDPAGS